MSHFARYGCDLFRHPKSKSSQSVGRCTIKVQTFDVATACDSCSPSPTVFSPLQRSRSSLGSVSPSSGCPSPRPPAVRRSLSGSRSYCLPPASLRAHQGSAGQWEAPHGPAGRPAKPWGQDQDRATVGSTSLTVWPSPALTPRWTGWWRCCLAPPPPTPWRRPSRPPPSRSFSGSKSATRTGHSLPRCDVWCIFSAALFPPNAFYDDLMYFFLMVVWWRFSFAWFWKLVRLFWISVVCLFFCMLLLSVDVPHF